MLACCKPLEEVAVDGITLDQWACLARCNNARVDLSKASSSSEDAFRAELVKCVSAPNAAAGVLCVSYSRKQFNQTGDGHFSPVAAYEREKDMALIMDVARFKHPPHWVPVSELFQSMQRLDPSTGESRGYATLNKDNTVGGTLFLLNHTFGRFSEVATFFESDLPEQLKEAGFENSPEEYLWFSLFHLPGSIAGMISTFADQHAAGAALTPKSIQAACEASYVCGTDCSPILTELQSTPLYQTLEGLQKTKKSHPLPVSLESAVMLLLALNHSIQYTDPLQTIVQAAIGSLTDRPALKAEVEGLQKQLALAISPSGPWAASHDKCCEEK